MPTTTESPACCFAIGCGNYKGSTSKEVCGVCIGTQGVRKSVGELCGPRAFQVEDTHDKACLRAHAAKVASMEVDKARSPRRNFRKT